MSTVAQLALVKTPIQPEDQPQIVGELDGKKYTVIKREQNALKGVLWNAVGNSLTGLSLVLTVGTAALMLVSLVGLTVEKSVKANKIIGKKDPSFTAAGVIGLGIISAAVDYCAVKFTARCLRNSEYHLGPQLQIVETK